jgi:Rrf2 family iron-sulfur cluster assembly transcriptional regulator
VQNPFSPRSAPAPVPFAAGARNPARKSCQHPTYRWAIICEFWLTGGPTSHLVVLAEHCEQLIEHGGLPHDANNSAADEVVCAGEVAFALEEDLPGDGDGIEGLWFGHYGLFPVAAGGPSKIALPASDVFDQRFANLLCARLQASMKPHAGVGALALRKQRFKPRTLRMPLLPRKGVLAIAAVIDIAVHGRNRPVGAKALASPYGLTARHLESVLQALVRHGILRSVRGPRGGYELAREQRNVSADDILRAAVSVDEMYSEPFTGSPLLEQVVMPALAQAEQAFSSALGAINVEDLTRMAEIAHKK